MEGFTFYKSFYETLKKIRKKQDRALAMLAVAEFMFDDEEPQDLSEVGEIAFESFRHILQKAKNMSGRGGRPSAKKEETNLDESENQTENQFETNLKPNQNQFETNLDENENQNETNSKTSYSYSSSLSYSKTNKVSKKERNIYNNNQSAGACACVEDENETQSHEDIMREYGLDVVVCESLKDFLRHCYLNKHIVSNAKLSDIIFRLIERYGNDKKGMTECIELAIRGGYFDVKA